MLLERFKITLEVRAIQSDDAVIVNLRGVSDDRPDLVAVERVLHFVNGELPIDEIGQQVVAATRKLEAGRPLSYFERKTMGAKLHG